MKTSKSTLTVARMALEAAQQAVAAGCDVMKNFKLTIGQVDNHFIRMG